MSLLEESFSNLADKILILQSIKLEKWCLFFCCYISYCGLPLVTLTAHTAWLTTYFKEKRCFLVNIFSTNLLYCYWKATDEYIQKRIYFPGNKFLMLCANTFSHSPSFLSFWSYDRKNPLGAMSELCREFCETSFGFIFFPFSWGSVGEEANIL